MAVKSNLGVTRIMSNNINYIDEHHPDYIVRTFTSLINCKDIVLDSNKKDNQILAVSGNGWKLQIDDQNPVELSPENNYFIPKETFHRIIKGNGDLILKIKEL